MGRRSVRPVSILLTSCIAASLFTGCDMPWGKKKVQQEAVEAYLGACLEFDYRTAASLVDDKDDAFQDIVLESPQRDICELVMSRAQFEVLKVDNDRALVKLTMPDIDRALKRENIPALELEDLEDIIDDTDKMLEEEFEFDFIKDGKEWLIDPDSTEEFAEFVSEIGLEVASEIGIGSGAKDFFNAYMTFLKEGNIDAAYSMLYGNGYASGGGGFFGADTNVLLAEFYSSVFGSVEYEAEVVSCSGSSVTLEITGTRADIASSVAYVSGNDAEVSVQFLKRMMIFYINVNSYDYGSYDTYSVEDMLYGYMEALIEFYIACIDAADSESFTCEIEMEVDENGNYSFDCDPASDMLGDIDEPEFADGFYEQALDELLASGEITQSQYNDLRYLDIDDLTMF